MRCIFTGFIALLLFSSFKLTSDSKDLEQLGKQIFLVIKQNDFNGIKQLIVSAKQVESTLDNFEMDDQKRENMKLSFAKKIQDDSAITVKKIEDGFIAIRKKLQEKKCKGESEVRKITPATTKLKNLPFELGDLSIEFNCGKETETINVEIIKTDTGWFILEKLRLVVH